CHRTPRSAVQGRSSRGRPANGQGGPMSHILVVDNYDSFTYNLVQAFLGTGVEVTVEYNDDLTRDLADEIAPTHLVISPGPGRPEDAGVSVEMIRHFAGRIPVLGVCLGHQAIGVAFGA